MRGHAKERFLRHHPLCCFCGGEQAAAECDHQPSRSLFPEQWGRPRSLIFPACASCNDISIRAESVLPIVLSDDSADEQRRARFRKTVRAHADHRPERISSILPSNRNKREILRQSNLTIPSGVFLENLPLVMLPVGEWRPHIEMLARKLTLALHYHYSARPLTRSGRMWFTANFNFDKLSGRIGPELRELLTVAVPDDEMSIGNEFQIGHVVDRVSSCYGNAISIRDRLLIVSFSTEHPETFPEVAQSDLWGPFEHNETRAQVA